MKRKYNSANVTIVSYGSGRKKRFIVYADYKESVYGPWHTRVYPDVTGNATEALREALQWLNEGEISEPWIIRNKPSKFFIVYTFGA